MAGNTPTFAASNLQWVGVGPETTYGTPLATPTYFIPADTPVWKKTIAKLDDTALRGSMAVDYAQINGIRYDEVTFKTNPHIDSIYYLVRAALGLPDVVSGTTAPYTHKTSLQNGSNGQPQSSTVFWADGAGNAWQMPGAQISTIKFVCKPDALVEVDVTFIGLPAVSITAPSNTPTTTAPMPGWTSTVQVGGTQFNQFSELDIEIKRATEMIPVLNGTQSPLAIFAGPVSIAGTMTSVYQGSSDVILADEINNTQPAIVVTMSSPGDSVHTLALQSSVCAFDSADPSGTNKWTELKSAYKGIANTIDVAGGGGLSPLLATLVNTSVTAI